MPSLPSRRAVISFCIAMAALTASAKGDRLVLDEIRMEAVGQPARSRVASEPTPSLDLVFGDLSSAGVPVTIPTGTIAGGETSDGVHYPAYELLTPATGLLSGGGTTLSLSVEGQLLVTWGAAAEPQLYDVVLTALPAVDREGGYLDVFVEGWKAGSDRNGEPSFSVTLPARLE